MSTIDLSPLKNARRTRILDAAEHLFLQQGFRTVTVEAIAAEASMSKVTVYGYFPDKEAVFTAIVERLSERMHAAVFGALAGPGNLENRFHAALLAKHRIVFESVRRSVHARDLFLANDRVNARLIGELDDQIRAMMIAACLAEGWPDASAFQLARLLFGAAQGLANQSANLEMLDGDLSLVTRGVVQLLKPA